MKKEEKILFDEINSCAIFVVLGTENYLNSLKDKDNLDYEHINFEICVARQLNKKFILVIDSKMSENEIIELERYFANDNVIKEMFVNFDDTNSVKNTVMNITAEFEKEGI